MRHYPGWWSATAKNDLGLGTHGDSNGNYIVGKLGDDWYNNYFSFDLSALSFAATDAYLVLAREGAFGLPTIYELYDVKTDVHVLNNKSESANRAIFDDLGTGVRYARIRVDDWPDNMLVIRLNEAALFDINANAGGWFSIGGTLHPVPEPNIIAMSVAGGMLLMWRGRRWKT